MPKLKICLVGEEVGKTNFALRVANDTFLNQHKKTEGLEVLKTELEIGQNTIEINLFDTNLEQFYKNTDGFIVFYDTTHLDSYHLVTKNVKKVREHTDDADILIFGTKSDLEEKRRVSTSLAQEHAQRLKCQWAEGSAKNATNVHGIFEKFITGIVQKAPKDDQPLEDSETSLPTIQTTRSILREKLRNLEDRESKLEREKRELDKEMRKIKEELDDGVQDRNSVEKKDELLPSRDFNCFVENTEAQDKMNSFCLLL
jgi:GTPase SAR1 family protein